MVRPNNSREYEIVSISDESADDRDEVEAPLTEAKQENVVVIRLKLVLLALFFLSAVGISFSVYIFARSAELARFEDHIINDANKLLDAIRATIENTVGSLDSLSTTIAAHAKATNQTWPFVTISHFANCASKALSVSVNFKLALGIVVTAEQRLDWETYSWDNSGWINHTLNLQQTDPNFFGEIIWDANRSREIYGTYGVPYNSSNPYLVPTWQSYPAVPKYEPAYNWDPLSLINHKSLLVPVEMKRFVISEPQMLPDPKNKLEVDETEMWKGYLSDYIKPGDETNEPFSGIIYPVINELDTIRPSEESTANIAVAVVSSLFYWRDVFKSILPQGEKGIIVVMENQCSPSFTYQIDGPNVKYIGRGDHHDVSYDNLGIHGDFFEINAFSDGTSKYSGARIDKDYCPFKINIYPSNEMKYDYTSYNPLVFSSIVFLVFLFTAKVFILYERKVEIRQNKVMSSAVRTNAIVSSLYPIHVRAKILEESDRSAQSSTTLTSNVINQSDYFNYDDQTQFNGLVQCRSSRPIADLYPETTVLFADIVGFTAWSSVRDAYQVFTLLETLFGAFDNAADNRKVFKVETIGDCYLAITGCPVAMPDHAEAMSLFATDMLTCMYGVTRNLYTSLGRDTLDLNLRIGLNSGPTTAGVLRNNKSRYQVFGDTVNTASRMESNCLPGRIQCTQKTADLLLQGGKSHWLTKREDLVNVKGKGMMQTYNITTSPQVRRCSLTEVKHLSKKTHQLINWNIDALGTLVKKVAASRSRSDCSADPLCSMRSSTMPIDEISDIIELPCHSEDIQPSVDFEMIELSSNVQSQLADYITEIACRYRDNPFHNFEHASHVVMSTRKLIDRIVSADLLSSDSHITLDPLVQFAIVFGALIHDVDHTGISNMQLAQEDSLLAQRYESKCIAEQNSIDVAWELFMESSYKDLRECLFANELEIKLFRQIIVNVVLATDIFDVTMKAFREIRWENAFSNTTDSNLSSPTYNSKNSRAAIVIEHLIQTSDVVHTMQHWTVYQKWNQLLFQECMIAYQSGRASTHPAERWYEGELSFFDNYVVPLAKKLRVCGVFGVSCDELLDYAIDNRNEWEIKGRRIVQEWKEIYDLKRESLPSF